MAEVERLFKTKDINLAAYLKLKGYLIGKCVEENGKIIFGFVEDDTNKTDKDVTNFYNNEGQFLHYAGMWRDLKSIVFNTKNS